MVCTFPNRIRWTFPSRVSVSSTSAASTSWSTATRFWSGPGRLLMLKKYYCLGLEVNLSEGNESDQAVENYYSLQHFLLNPEVLKDWRRRGGYSLTLELVIHQKWILVVTANPFEPKVISNVWIYCVCCLLWMYCSFDPNLE